jgi:hypothetical protein
MLIILNITTLKINNKNTMSKDILNDVNKLKEHRRRNKQEFYDAFDTMTPTMKQIFRHIMDAPEWLRDDESYKKLCREFDESFYEHRERRKRILDARN